MERSSGSQLVAKAIDQPTLQSQVDLLAGLSRRLDKTLLGIDEALDRLISRPPRPVAPPEDRSVGGSAPVARPPIEGALNMHGSYLEGMCTHAEELLARLNRAV